VVNSGTVQLAGGVSGSYTSVPYTAVLSITELRKSMRTLEGANAFRVGGSQNPSDQFLNNGYWIAVVSPNAKYDLEGDTTTGAWIDANKYAGSERLFSGEIGKLYGIRFLQSSNAMNNGSGLIATATQTYNVHTTLVTGSDYFGVTTLQNLQTYIKDFGSAGTADPTNKVATAGWKCMFGATVLNSAFGVSLQHAVSN
jgi:N4-gp56 family major capsid protein